MSSGSSEILRCAWLGRQAWQDSFDLMKRLHAERVAERIPDTILFLEHDPVITMGIRADENDVLSDAAVLEAEGIEVLRTNRGGQVTYHGPGQLIGYFIIHLYKRERELRAFIENMELSLIELLARHGIQGAIEEGSPGIWVGQDKIVALGISVHEKVTMHGFALNVNTNLEHFGHIVACGKRNRGQCSMASLLPADHRLDLSELAAEAGSLLAGRLSYRTEEWIRPEDLLARN